MIGMVISFVACSASVALIHVALRYQKMLQHKREKSFDKDEYDALIAKLYIDEPIPADAMSELRRMIEMKDRIAQHSFGQLPTADALHFLHAMIERAFLIHFDVMRRELQQDMEKMLIITKIVRQRP